MKKHRKAAKPRTRELDHVYSHGFTGLICRRLVVSANTSTAHCWSHPSAISVRVYCRSSECLNGSSVGWQYSGCVQPLLWSGNIVSVGNWPDHTHNSHWVEGQFALLSPELFSLQSACIAVQDSENQERQTTLRWKETIRVRKNWERIAGVVLVLPKCNSNK